MQWLTSTPVPRPMTLLLDTNFSTSSSAHLQSSRHQQKIRKRKWNFNADFTCSHHFFQQKPVAGDSSAFDFCIAHHIDMKERKVTPSATLTACLAFRNDCQTKGRLQKLHIRKVCREDRAEDAALYDVL